MNVVKYLEWKVILNGGEQAIYYIGRPNFSFKTGEAKWIPFSIEMPIRILDSTREWIDVEKKVNLEVKCVDGNKLLVHEWLIKGAKAASSVVQKSRVVDMKILNVVVDYDWASIKR